MARNKNLERAEETIEQLEKEVLQETDATLKKKLLLKIAELRLKLSQLQSAHNTDDDDIFDEL